MINKKIAVVGGGASGFFAAINYALKNTADEVVILEKSSRPLQKVRISGGGRCNVTNHCFEVADLIQHYPRGSKELKSVFYNFQPQDTIEWFAKHGVKLVAEPDNRMFPSTNISETIIDCFLKLIAKLKIKIIFKAGVNSVKLNEEGKFLVKTKEELYTFDTLIMAAGSSKPVWTICENLGHTIVPAVPSLFTFNIKSPLLKDLAGLSMPAAQLEIKSKKLKESGPLLITHWGLSGPAVLKLSAWGARKLEDIDYSFPLKVNWIALKQEEAYLALQKYKEDRKLKKISNTACFDIPKRLWLRFVELAKIPVDKIWADISNKEMRLLAENLTAYIFEVKGKSTFKDEFVTAGGIKLKEVNFKTMESKIVPNLYFCGELLNIDGITGGFNFQAAWSTAYIAANNA